MNDRVKRIDDFDKNLNAVLKVKRLWGNEKT